MTDRPQQVAHPKVYGNFKKRGLEKAKAKTGNSKWREERPGMSEDHLALIRKMPCCDCLKLPGGEAHHLKANTGERGMAVRSTDRWALPMCHEHHMQVEAVGAKRETAHFQDMGFDPIELAQDLWNASGDLAKMVRVLTAHRL
jgi:hypothetical protein